MTTMFWGPARGVNAVVAEGEVWELDEPAATIVILEAYAEPLENGATWRALLLCGDPGSFGGRSRYAGVNPKRWSPGWRRIV